MRRSSAERARAGGRRRVTGALLTVAAWGAASLFFLPVLWMVLTTFHAEPDAATNPPSVAAPLTLENYASFFSSNPWPPILNSISASVGSTVLVIALALPAAYALAIKPVRRWTDVLFFALSTKFLPVVVGLLPLYLFATTTGLQDNIAMLVLLYTSMNLPIALWMLQRFLAEIPKEMLEAAELDGAGLATTLRSVIAPVALPGIAATSLICLIFSWNELLLARTLTATVAGTAPVFLTSFLTSQGLFLAQMCTAAFVISLPVLLAGFVAQDKLVQGLSMGAVK
nr:carbohydrate ABC transporter permease [Pseudonocardia cypriaca]